MPFGQPTGGKSSITFHDATEGFRDYVRRTSTPTPVATKNPTGRLTFHDATEGFRDYVRRTSQPTRAPVPESPRRHDSTHPTGRLTFHDATEGFRDYVRRTSTPTPVAIKNPIRSNTSPSRSVTFHDATENFREYVRRANAQARAPVPESPRRHDSTHPTATVTFRDAVTSVRKYVHYKNTPIRAKVTPGASKYLAGPLHLWSGDKEPNCGHELARKAASKKGHLLEHMPEGVKALAEDEALTAEALRLGFKRNPDGSVTLPQDVVDGTWRGPSETAVKKAVLSEKAIHVHVTKGKQPGRYLRKYELPMAKKTANVVVAVAWLAGAVSIAAAAQSDNSVAKWAGMAGGAGDVGGSIAYKLGTHTLAKGVNAGTKMAKVGTQMMRYGRWAMRYVGGAGGAIFSGISAYEDFKKKDIAHGVGNSAGAAAGVLTFVGVGAFAAVAGALSVGYGVGTLAADYAIPEKAQRKTGEYLCKPLEWMGFHPKTWNL